MANCLMSLTGIPYACETNLAGVKRLYLIDWNHVNSVTLDASNNSISGISLENSEKFKKYVFAKNTGALTKTLTKDESKGTKYYLNEFTCNFNRMDPVKRKELETLASGQIAAIVEDMNGFYWFLGKDNYTTVTALTAQSGATTDDGNFYTLTIQDKSGQLPYTIDSSAIDGILE